MLLLLIFWCILLAIAMIISTRLKVDKDDLFLAFLLGVAVLSVFLQGWAFFLPVKHALVPVFIFCIYTLFNKSYRSDFLAKLNGLRDQLNFQNIIILLVFLFIGSMPSYINDDAAYYQQTIKWFSEYGYVPGLANLKIQFGHASSWHLIASAFYFDEMPFTRDYNFNGLALWVLIISILKIKKAKFQLITLTVLFSFGALFVNTPSPDLVVMVGTIWVLLNYKAVKPVYLAVIIGFLLSVKVTAGGLLFIFFPLFYNKLEDSNEISKVLIALTVFGALLIVKNVIVTGYPLYPITTIMGYTEYRVPEIIMELSRIHVIEATFDKFHLSLGESHDVIYNYWERFIALFQVRGYKIIMNLLSVLAFVLTPILLFRKSKRHCSLLAIIIIINGIGWFLQAPNYRFVLGFIIYMFYLIIENVHLVKFSSKLKTVLFSATLFVVIVFHLNMSSLLFLVNCGEKQRVSYYQLIYPSPYESISYKPINGFNIVECAYCFNTPLPCYSKPVMDSYIRSFNFDVRYRDKEDVSKGFVTKPLRNQHSSDKK